jgi:recombinase
VRAILKNGERYTGWVVYGATKIAVRNGRRRNEPAAAPPIRHHDEARRIWSEDLWAAIQAENARRARLYQRNPRGHVIGRAPGGRSSAYLLSGLAHHRGCEGGGLWAVHRSHRGGLAPDRYECPTARNRPGRCAGFRVPMADADAAVLAALARALAPEALDAGFRLLVAARAEDAARARAEVQQRHAEAARWARDIAGLERQLIDGAPWRLIEPILSPLRAEQEAHARALQLAEAAQAADAALLDQDWRDACAHEIGAVRASLLAAAALGGAPPTAARALLSRMLEGRMLEVEARGGGWRFLGEANILAALSGGDGRCGREGSSSRRSALTPALRVRLEAVVPAA